MSKTMTKAQYVAAAVRYYEHRLFRRKRSALNEVPSQARMLYHVVEAALKAVVPGRQNMRTAGWKEEGLRAHRRAAEWVK